jgi:hypothetical protein
MPGRNNKNLIMGTGGKNLKTLSGFVWFSMQTSRQDWMIWWINKNILSRFLDLSCLFCPLLNLGFFVLNVYGFRNLSLRLHRRSIGQS